MKKGFVSVLVVALMVIPLAIVGCKSKANKEAEMVKMETTEAVAPVEDVVVSQAPVTEPVATQVIAQETIPPTAAVPPAATDAASVVGQDKLAKNKEIQAALKAANFYTGNVDGKMGPKTKKAIIEFQKSKGLKADGKVGPKTWSELEKYLTVKQ